MKKILKLKQARKSRKVTQVMLAARMGVHQGQISVWERGVKAPFPHTLAAIAKALRCKVEELV